MIALLRGRIIEATLEKDSFRVILDVQGVGYEIFLSKAADLSLSVGQNITLHVKESVAPFDGSTTLYGFTRAEEKELFMKIRDKVSGMGPKKALDVMDKISKSLPDFKRAIIDNDHQLLISVFGFTKKTAEKLCAALKGQADSWKITGSVKWSGALKTGHEVDAVSGLINLGYREEEARDAVVQAKTKLGSKPEVTRIIQEALKQLGSKVS